MVEATKEYVQNVSRRTPGLIIFLIDQSSSMDGSIFTQSGKNYTKAMVVADCVNRWILELLGKCCAGAEFRNLLGFTFIGYSTEISSALPAIDLSRYPIVASELAKSYITKMMVINMILRIIQNQSLLGYYPLLVEVQI